MEKLYWNREQCEMCNILTLKQQILSFKHFVILSVLLLLLLGGYFLHFFSLSILHPALVRPSLRPPLSMIRSCVHHFHWLTKTIWRSSSNFVNNDFHIYAAKLIVSRTEDEEVLYSRYFVYVFFFMKERFYGKEIRYVSKMEMKWLKPTDLIFCCDFYINEDNFFFLFILTWKVKICIHRTWKSS